MRWNEYCFLLNYADRNQALMARILANRMCDPKTHPVDISELRLLSNADRAATVAFIDWTKLREPEGHPGGPVLDALVQGLTRPN